jgi:hypothetical protein
MSTRVAVLHDYVQPMELDSRAKDSGALQISASSRDTVLIPEPLCKMMHCSSDAADAPSARICWYAGVLLESR